MKQNGKKIAIESKKCIMLEDMTTESEQKAVEAKIAELYPVHPFENGLGCYWLFDIDPTSYMAKSKMEFHIDDRNIGHATVRPALGNEQRREPTLEEMIDFLEKAKQDIPEHDVLPKLQRTAIIKWAEEANREHSQRIENLGQRVFKPVIEGGSLLFLKALAPKSEGYFW